MQLPKALLGLPTSLLLLVADQLQAQELVQQQQQQQQQLLPTAIKKMSPDSGEKLLPEHYAFAPSAALLPTRQQPRSPTLTPEGEEEGFLLQLDTDNGTSSSSPFLAPFAIHYDYHYPHESRQRRQKRGDTDRDKDRESALARLRGRQFSCPPDTAACTNIDQPHYCCAEGTTCFAVDGVPDAGNVGCCPEGRSCGGSVGRCAAGATACSVEVGGGCCIAGFVCAEVGCIASTVSIITQTTTQSTTISSSPTTVITTVIVTITPTESRVPETSTVTQTTTASPPPDTETDALPPVRPTSSNNNSNSPPPTSTSRQSSATTSTTAEYCPTGFYACEARAGPGCCRTGRDCATTSCPPPTGVLTTIEGAEATVVVPLPDPDPTTASTTDDDDASCAFGWYLCPEDAGAGAIPGCCPSGYGCGVASCTLARATETATAQKMMPNGAARGRGSGSVCGGKGEWWGCALLFVAGVVLGLI